MLVAETKTHQDQSAVAEIVPEAEARYLAYWQEVAADPSRFGFKPHQVDVVRGMASINGPQLKVLDSFLKDEVKDLGHRPVGEVPTADILGLAFAAYRWFQALGSQNHMEGALPTVSRVADLLIAHIPRDNLDHASDLRRFAAQLYHEAAFLTDPNDTVDFRHYADKSKSILAVELAKQGEDLRVLGTSDMLFRLRSELYINDLNQELIRRQMRDYVERGNQGDRAFDVEPLLARARREQSRTIQAVRELMEANNSHPDGDRPLNNGFFFEAFVELGLRNDIVAPGIPNGPEVFMRNGVRFSSSREDKPYDMSQFWGAPNLGVDAVIDKYEYNSGHRTNRSYIQAKSKTVRVDPSTTAPKTEFVVGTQRNIDYKKWLDSLDTELTQGSDDTVRHWVFD